MRSATIEVILDNDGLIIRQGRKSRIFSHEELNKASELDVPVTFDLNSPLDNMLAKVNIFPDGSTKLISMLAKFGIGLSFTLIGASVLKIVADSFWDGSSYIHAGFIAVPLIAWLMFYAKKLW